jgi:hypothetical protein
MLWKLKKSDDRRLISRADLQSAITEAVKQYDSDCEAMVDVIVERALPRSRLDANWAIKGIRFGRADRQKAGEAITVIVTRMQGEFTLSEQNTVIVKNS